MPIIMAVPHFQGSIESQYPSAFSFSQSCAHRFIERYVRLVRRSELEIRWA